MALARAIRQRVRHPVGVEEKNGTIVAERVVRSLSPFLPGRQKDEPVAVAWLVTVPFTR